jgi:hypothetical protein
MGSPFAVSSWRNCPGLREAERRIQGAMHAGILGLGFHTLPRIRSRCATHAKRANASRAIRHNQRDHPRMSGGGSMLWRSAPTSWPRETLLLNRLRSSLPPGVHRRGLEREVGETVGMGLVRHAPGLHEAAHTTKRRHPSHKGERIRHAVGLDKAPIGKDDRSRHSRSEGAGTAIRHAAGLKSAHKSRRGRRARANGGTAAVGDMPDMCMRIR